MRLHGLDLNLIVALDVLLDTLSIARSAERMNLSQPAMSAALNRLREYFQDPLLIREGKCFFPTDLALALRPRIDAFLKEAGGIIEQPNRFDPAESRRTFRIVGSDYSTTIFLTKALCELSVLAPHMTIDIRPPGNNSLAALRDGSVDIVIGPDEYRDKQAERDLLCSDRYVIAGCATNSIFEKALTKSALSQKPYVVSTFGNHRSLGYGDQAFESHAIERKIEISTSSFASLPVFLIGTSRLSVMYERLAMHYAQFFPITYARAPFITDEVNFWLSYLPVRKSDSGLNWLRNLLRSSAAG